MASWNRRARIGVAIFGLAIALVVYLAMGERQVAGPPEPVTRMDPRAALEAYAYVYERTTGVERNFDITFDRSQSYSDGSTKGFGVRITVPKGEGRTFVVTAAEGSSGPDQAEFELTGDVRLEDSDGFVLLAEHATYQRADSIARVPGAVTFAKGRMTGAGVGVTYDQANSVLTVADQAEVTTVDEEGRPTMAFTAGAATLDRAQHRLTLSTAVHAIHAEQVIDTDHAVARLTETDDVVTFMELRGNSRVEGGGAIEAMSARDIDLDYGEGGERLEAVALDGSASVAMTDANGASQQIVAESVDLTLPPDGSSRIVLEGSAAITMSGGATTGARRFSGEAFELDVAADGTVTRAVGRDNVRLDLPAAAGAPVRSIRARTLDGTGTAGQGLTATTFTGDVVFTETATSAGGTSMRTARARQLQAMLESDAVTTATFTGDVTFEEAGLKACAGRLAYEPIPGRLALSGSSAIGNPTVAEEQLTVEAQAIDVTLESRRMLATGAVNTRMGTATRCAPASARPAAEQGATRRPGLLSPDAAVTITAPALEYQGATGTAVYSERATLLQGETTIQADTIRIDQSTGDLTATGNVTSTMMLDGESSIAQAYELQYVDRTRRLTLAAPPPGYVPPPAPARGSAPVTEPRLNGPQGDLRAGRIVIALGAGGGTAERLEARTGVRLTQGLRSISGGATLTYDPGEDKYVVSGSGTAPVTLVDRQGGCREWSGRTITFYKASDRLEIDGENRNRTQASACASGR